MENLVLWNAANRVEPGGPGIDVGAGRESRAGIGEYDPMLDEPTPAEEYPLLGPEIRGCVGGTLAAEYPLPTPDIRGG